MRGGPAPAAVDGPVLPADQSARETLRRIGADREGRMGGEDSQILRALRIGVAAPASALIRPGTCSKGCALA